MFKKALKIAISFGVLLAAHVGYVRIFAIVAERAAMGRAAVVQLLPTDSRTKKEAIALAAKAFGEEHWSADPELPGRYYNKERGYWMYYEEYDRRAEGKQFLFKRFALIWQSRDKKELKTVTADEAVIDLDRPMGLMVNKPGTPPMRIVHAQITGNVLIRDDKGTSDAGDDMLIGPMPYAEYDERTLQIRSESDVVIQDREMWVNGYNLLIQLRAKDEADPTAGNGGFNGAKTLYLTSNVHIILHDSGHAGFLPGKTDPRTTKRERTPVDLRSAGQMQIDLPKPRLPVRVGPPAPPDPTIATFTRDVVVKQTKPNQIPDQLNCDYLKLTLLPGKKSAEAEANGDAGAAMDVLAAAQAVRPPDDAADESGGALGGLTLRRADATGHAVWLQSVSQGIKTRSNELIYKKLAPEKPDETYLRGDTTTKLLVWKLDIPQDGPNKGKITSITTIQTIDATIFDDGQSRDPETIVARGPGILETRPARDKPVERRAVWQDQLVMQNEIGADKQLRKRITLTRDAKFFDIPQATTLDAKTEIIVWLKPKPEPATAAPAAGAGLSQVPGPKTAPAQAGSGKFDLETLRALDDVHLVAPGRLLTARDVLVAVFETPPAPPGPAATGTTSSGASSDAPSGPAVATAEAAAPGAQAEAKPKPKVEAKPAEPDVNVRAHQVWARIALAPKAEPGGATSAGPAERSEAANTRSEVREARLRGAVYFHQDPAPGKERGTSVTGEAVDVTNLGDNKMYFKVFHVDPHKVLPLDKNTKILERELLARMQAFGKSMPLAKVDTDEFTVEGPIIGLNQLTDEAWVDGRGKLTQMAPRGLLSDKGLDKPQAKPAAGPAQAKSPANMTPLKIAWTRAMQFKGQSTNPKGVPVARAQFFANVRAEMEDSLLVCQEMTTYMDRVVKLNRSRSGQAAPGAGGNEAVEPEPKPQIALIDCLYKVLVDSRKVDPENRTLLQRQIIEGEHVIYDKLTGNFVALPAPGELGRVFLYSREGQETLNTPATGSGPSTPAERRTIRPTANPSSRPAPNTRRATEVVGRNGNGTPGVNPAVSGRPAATTKAQPKLTKPALAPLKLTQIVYADEMHGRFGSGKDRDTAEPRWADFFGDVEVLHGPVANENVKFDFDDPPRDGTILTAQTVRVVSEPPPPGSNGPGRNFLKAWEDANAETIDTTIQADKITYDSSKELFCGYGEVDQVYIVQQKIVGQPPVTASGSTVWYNRKTGESQIDDPKTVQFVDDKFGARPVQVAAGPEQPKRKKPLAPFRGPGRAHYERKGFNGH